MENTNMDDNLNFDTLAVRAGTLRSDFNEHSEAIFLTSSFVFESAAHAAESFKNSEEAYTYSRFTNPTVAMFQNRLAALEGGEACMATASGMAAIMSVVMCSMQQGDHLVSSKSLFGSTIGHVLADLHQVRHYDHVRRSDQSGRMASRRASRDEDVLPRNAVESADRRLRILRRSGRFRRKWARCLSSITVSVARHCSSR